ncbi:hypothetical protein P8605_39420 [Streptomyces sp. T-3]|nr:hypothetical protein [Streptomyces sp. T-3]
MDPIERPLLSGTEPGAMFESDRIVSYVFELWWLRMGDHYL